MAEILKRNLERENRLKELKEAPKENGKEINKLLLEIRNDYIVLLLDHPTLSSAIKKDIDGLMWKQCFYKQIEEYRRSIKKTSLLIAEGGQSPMTEKARQHLIKLTTFFFKFLTDSLAIYQDMLAKVFQK
jgi:hypothetical protein